MTDKQQGRESSPEDEHGWERRSGEDRRKAERRGLEIPVEKNRRSGWDRRRGERRTD